MSEYSPVVQFQQRKNDNLRIEGGGGDNVPSWFLQGDALTERVKVLTAELSAIKKAVESRSQNRYAAPYVCLARMHEKATAKSYVLAAAGTLTAEAAATGTVSVRDAEGVQEGWAATVEGDKFVIVNPRPSGLAIILR